MVTASGQRSPEAFVPSSMPAMRSKVQTDCRSIGQLFRYFVRNVPDSSVRFSAQDRPGQTPVFSPHRRDRHPMAYPRQRVATSLLPNPNHQRSHWPRCRSRGAVLAPVPHLLSQYRLPLRSACVVFDSSEPLFASFKVETTIDRWAISSGFPRKPTNSNARGIRENSVPLLSIQADVAAVAYLRGTRRQG